MDKFLFVLLLVTANGYFGLEEVEVTLMSDKRITFRGVITIVPHTENVVIWHCESTSIVIYIVRFTEID